MTNELLLQYSSLRKEIPEVKEKIAKLERDIENIEAGETVVDSVSGGNGGKQHFRIEGTPYPEYSRKKTLLYARKATLELLEEDLSRKTNEIEEFIAHVPDSRIRRIINLRFVEGLTWNQVADRIGGGNTDESVKKMYQRYIK